MRQIAGTDVFPIGLGAMPMSLAGRQPPRAARFVEPRLVCAVDYSEWTQARTLRHPSYKGLRDDLDPEDVACEEVDAA